MGPRRAYEEVKQLALSIEQSKIMHNARKTTMASWRVSSDQYHSLGGHKVADQGRGLHREEQIREMNRREPEGVHRGSPSTRSRFNTAGAKQGANDNRKCYNSSKYGHIGKDCPQRLAKVNQIEYGGKLIGKEKQTISDVVREARSLGMAVKENT